MSTFPANPQTAVACAMRRKAIVLDVVEWILVQSLYVWMLVRMVADSTAEDLIANSILLFSEGLIVVLFLVRRSSHNISRRLMEWFLALGASCAPLLVCPVHHEPRMPAAAILVMISGILLQVSAKVVLARSVGIVPANRGVKTSGPYRFVRHPMYAGYLITHIGFLTLNPSWWNLAAYVACYALQIPRLLAEERLLRHDSSYRDYCEQVPFRLIPGVF